MQVARLGHQIRSAEQAEQRLAECHPLAVSLRFGELVLQERRQALSEAARSVGGGAAIGHSQWGQTTAGGIEMATAQRIHYVVQASKNLDPLRIQAELELAAEEFGLSRSVDEVVQPAI